MQRTGFRGRRHLGRTTLLVALGLTASCQNTSTDPTLSNFDSLVISAVDDNIEATVGQPTSVRIRVTDEAGRSISGAPVSLEVLSKTGLVSPEVAWTNSEGIAEAIWVLGGTAGEYQLAATGDDARMYRQFRRIVLRARARPSDPYSIDITPSGAVVAPGETQQFDARVADRYGNALDGVDVDWRVADPAVASVDSKGLVTGLSAGTTPLIASALTSRGQTISGYGWVATEDASGGESTDSGTQTPSAVGRVTDLRIVGSSDHSITVALTEVDDGTGQPANYAIRRGSPTISWSLAASTQQLIAGTGVGKTIEYTLTGLASDTYYQLQLVAYKGLLNQNAVFSELSNKVSTATAAASTAGPAAVVSVAARDDTYQFSALGASKTFEATAYDAAGLAVSGAALDWRSLDPSIASVDAGGTVTARSIGFTTILVAAACCPGAADAIEVTVSQMPTAVAVSPASFSLDVGGSQELSSTLTDANGNLVPEISTDWSSADPAIAVVSSSGVASGVAGGSTVVRASFGALSSGSSVQVLAQTGGGSAPQMPSNITVSAASGGLDVSWTTVAGATSYRLTWGPHDGSNTQTSQVSSSPTTLAASGDGFVCVRAVNGGLQSNPRCTSYSLPADSGTNTGSTGGSTGGGGDTTGGGGTTQDPYDPPPPPQGVFFEESFDYSSDAALNAGVAYVQGNVHMATGTRFDGSAGPFLRTWQNTDPEFESGVDLMPFEGRNEREFWLETYIRFGGDWSGTSDDKTLLVTESGGVRWDLHLRAGKMLAYTSATVDDTPPWFSSSPNIFDGSWHRVRLHYRMSSSPGRTDGAIQVWIDGALLLSKTSWNSGSPSSSAFQIVALGRNADPSDGSTRDWGRTLVFLSNPGW